jgi:type I thyroxine 5'-deiodinase
VEFLVIYIREAHPVDGWWLGKGIENLLIRPEKANAATDVYDPKTIEERQAVAGRCKTTLQYGIRTYVDGMDNAVNEAYAAMPTRLYLVGTDGRVVYAGGLGPFGFKPKELRTAIEEYLMRLGSDAS